MSNLTKQLETLSPAPRLPVIPSTSLRSSKQPTGGLARRLGNETARSRCRQFPARQTMPTQLCRRLRIGASSLSSTGPGPERGVGAIGRSRLAPRCSKPEHSGQLRTPSTSVPTWPMNDRDEGSRSHCNPAYLPTVLQNRLMPLALGCVRSSLLGSWGIRDPRFPGESWWLQSLVKVGLAGSS